MKVKKYKWPKLKFPPINLWSLPRYYENILYKDNRNL